MIIKREFRPFRPLEFRLSGSLLWELQLQSRFQFFLKIFCAISSSISMNGFSSDWKKMLSIAKYLDLMSIWSRSWQAFLIQFCWTSIYFLLCTMNFMRENGYRICKCMYLVTILWKKLFFILGCCECPADLDHYCWLLPFDCESHHLRLRIHRNSRYFFIYL